MSKTSPTASGVVVCCRMMRNPSCSSPVVASSIQKRWNGSSDLPSRAALNRRQSMMHVVEQMDVMRRACVRSASKSVGTKLRYFSDDQVCSWRQPLLRGLIGSRAARNAVRGRKIRDGALRSHGLVPAIDVCARPPRQSVSIGPAVGVAVNHDAVPDLAAEQVVERRIERLGLDVPQGARQRRQSRSS